MHFLIDCDSVIYKAGCANEERWWDIIDKDSGETVNAFQYKAEALEWTDNDKETYDYVCRKEAGPLSHSLSNTRHLLEKIIGHRQCSSYDIFIGGQDNYRKLLYKDYKATRDPVAKPIHEEQMRDYLQRKWNAQVVDGQEVDDEIGIRLTEDIDNNVCVTIDKDLDNVPGWHYNYDKEDGLYYIADDEAIWTFYCQVLSGDSTDNIPGLKGIGKKTAQKMLTGIVNEEDLCYTVWQQYLDKGHNYDFFLMNARLLWIRQKREETWQPPINLQ